MFAHHINRALSGLLHANRATVADVLVSYLVATQALRDRKISATRRHSDALHSHFGRALGPPLLADASRTLSLLSLLFLFPRKKF